LAWLVPVLLLIKVFGLLNNEALSFGLNKKLLHGNTL
jgi:hypothetical protein